MNPATDPIDMELAVMAGTLQSAIASEDVVQILVTTAALDRMARSLGPHQLAAATHARDIVSQALDALEAAVAQGQREPLQTRLMRAAYTGKASGGR